MEGKSLYGACGVRSVRRDLFLTEPIAPGGTQKTVRPIVPARLGQRHLFPEFVQVVGYNRPSQGLRPLWRVEPDLERDRDSRQHATQHNDPERGHCPGPSGPVFDERSARRIGRAQ